MKELVVSVVAFLIAVCIAIMGFLLMPIFLLLYRVSPRFREWLDDMFWEEAGP